MVQGQVGRRRARTNRLVATLGCVWLCLGCSGGSDPDAAESDNDETSTQSVVSTAVRSPPGPRSWGGGTTLPVVSTAVVEESTPTTAKATPSTTAVASPDSIAWAVRQGDATAVAALVDELGVEAIPPGALFDALVHDEIEVVALLLQLGLDPSLPIPDDRGPDDENRQPILQALSPAALDLLVAAGADINATSQLGSAVVRNALSRGDEALVIAALELGADPVLAAFNAVSFGNAVVLEWLFSNRAITPETTPRPGSDWAEFVGPFSLRDFAGSLGSELSGSIAELLEVEQ